MTVQPVTTTDAFLSGNYAPVANEITVDELEVEGNVPPALSGSYLRAGPNPLGDPPQPYHWFIGDGMLHNVGLADGRASYRNRWVRTASIADRLGEAPVDGPPQPLYDSSNTNVISFAGRILSLTEGTYPYEVSPDLETVRRFGFDGTLPHGLTAHPKVDPVTGELHAFSYWFEEPYLIYHVVDANGRLRVTEPMTLPAPVSMHDFAFTRNHVLFFDQPAVFDLELLGTRGFPVAWKPENGARVGVLPSGGTDADARWFETELGYTFHPMNGHDNDDGTIEIVLPLISSVFGDPQAVLDESARQSLQRWIVDPIGEKVHQEIIDETPQDFCRINERHLGSRNRYGYTTAIGAEMLYDDTRVFKHDFVGGTREDHDFGPGRHPGEMLFIADPERSTEEDGGWLLGLVHDDALDRTSLVVLDAQRVGDAPIAQVHVPRRIPYGFHGTWVADTGARR